MFFTFDRLKARGKPKKGAADATDLTSSHRPDATRYTGKVGKFCRRWWYSFPSEVKWENSAKSGGILSLVIISIPAILFLEFNRRQLRHSQYPGG